MTDPAVGREVTELFAGLGWPEGGDDLLRRSLRPRAPELLLDAPGWLGLGAGQLVLDAGCRDATHAVALARRYGCRVLGVDLVAAWLPTGLADAAAAGLAGRVALVQGDLLALPVADGACDLVWCRDVLSCLEDCRRALRECARVLRPGGGMVLYAVFATDQLAPVDRALLVQGLGNSPASMHQPTVEAAIAAAGFEVVRRERIASEWSEHSLERDPGYLAQDLLEVARLTRDRDRLEAALGPVWYQRALAFALWGIQIVLGRLVPVLYALTRPAGGVPGGSASKEGEAMGGVPLPEGYHSVNPYIVVDGAERLVDFLVAVFAGVEQGRSLRPDGRIDHGDVRIGDSLVMLSEASEAYPARPCVHFVYVEDVDATYRAALAAGATSILEPTEQPWGDRTCGFVDPFDNRWWVATHLRDFS